MGNEYIENITIPINKLVDNNNNNLSVIKYKFNILKNLFIIILSSIILIMIIIGVKPIVNITYPSGHVIIEHNIKNIHSNDIKFWLFVIYINILGIIVIKIPNNMKSIPYGI